ncbi:MAG TPA: serine/threonine protein kinase, partial [Streptomyces sp.]|nr:serine/threonine protein kinase [Streptomyces sp.]
ARPTIEQILERTTSDADPEPWLPSALIAQLGRHAVQLLEVEQPAAAPVQQQPPTMTAVSAEAPKPPVRMPTPPPPLPVAYSHNNYAYGPPQQPAYGYPQQQGPAPHFPTLHAPAPPRRRGTVALVAVALLVAVAAGTSVYAFMGDAGKKKDTGAIDDPKPGPTTSSPANSPTPGPSTSSSAPPSQDDGVPQEYLGTWQGSFDTADGTNTRVMTITEGATGETVMTLSGTGPNYDCRWSATLRTPGPPLELGPTQVTFGDPKQCSPGQWSRLDMPDDTTIVRELVGSGGEPITYTKQG